MRNNRVVCCLRIRVWGFGFKVSGFEVSQTNNLPVVGCFFSPFTVGNKKEKESSENGGL